MSSKRSVVSNPPPRQDILKNLIHQDLLRFARFNPGQWQPGNRRTVLFNLPADVSRMNDVDSYLDPRRAQQQLEREFNSDMSRANIRLNSKKINAKKNEIMKEKIKFVPPTKRRNSK